MLVPHLNKVKCHFRIYFYQFVYLFLIVLGLNIKFAYLNDIEKTIIIKFIKFNPFFIRLALITSPNKIAMY